MKTDLVRFRFCVTEYVASGVLPSLNTCITRLGIRTNIYIYISFAGNDHHLECIVVEYV